MSELDHDTLAVPVPPLPTNIIGIPMPDVSWMGYIMRFAEKFGYTALLVGFFVWRNDVNDHELREQMNLQTKFIQEKLITSLNSATAVMTQSNMIMGQRGVKPVPLFDPKGEE